MAFGRKPRNSEPGTITALADSPTSPSNSRDDDRTLTPGAESNLTKAQVKRATRTRQTFAFLSSLFLLISLIFLILTEIGSTYIKPVLTSIYFIKLDLSHIVPASVPNAFLINDIAQTIGLHDFYQVGLWSFCEGYNSEGVTFCSKPQTLYWFNPVEILTNELLAGATLALPADINTALDLIKTASQWMFALFFVGLCLEFIMLFITPLSLFSRWAALPIGILTLIAALATTVATVLATVMFIVLRNVITGVSELNISAELGAEMFAFMWIATAFALMAALIQLCLCCCCASRRDVKRGKKRGSEKAYVEK